MAVAFSKPIIHHGSLPIVSHPHNITYNYVSESEGKIHINIPDSFSTEENGALIEIFSQLFKIYEPSLPENWTEVEKYQVILDCSIKMLYMMN